MTKMLKITLNGETFLADMLWDKAPEACKLFESSCPVESRIFSAKICDAEVTYPVSGPIANYEHIENPVFHEPAGAVSWYGGWSSICIFFDVCEPASAKPTASALPLPAAMSGTTRACTSKTKSSRSKRRPKDDGYQHPAHARPC